MNRRASFLIISALSMAVGLTGCGTTAQAGPDPTAPTAVPSPSYSPDLPQPTPTPTPTAVNDAGGINLQGTANLKDKQGYTYTMSYQVTAPTGFVADPTNAPPGKTDLTMTSTTTVSVANTTPNRAAGSDGINFNAYGVYPLTSPACKMKQGPDISFYKGEGTQLGAAAGGMQYCVVLMSSDMFSYDPKIPVGGQIALQSNMGNPVSTQRISGVSEAETSADIQALNQPIATVALITNGGNANQVADVTSPYAFTGGCVAKIGIGLDANPQLVAAITALPLSGAKTVCP